jgi:hypothetical protein
MTGSAPAKAAHLVKKPTMTDRQLHDLRHAFNLFDSDGAPQRRSPAAPLCAPSAARRAPRPCAQAAAR